MGQVPAGVCNFDPKNKLVKERVGTRAGSIAIYCAHEAIANGGLDFEAFDKAAAASTLAQQSMAMWKLKTKSTIFPNLSTTPVIGRIITTRARLPTPQGNFDYLGITGPHYAIGAATRGQCGSHSSITNVTFGRSGFCARGRCGGIQSFGIFAGFKSQGALGTPRSEQDQSSIDQS